ETVVVAAIVGRHHQLRRAYIEGGEDLEEGPDLLRPGSANLGALLPGVPADRRRRHAAQSADFLYAPADPLAEKPGEPLQQRAVDPVGADDRRRWRVRLL